MPLSQPRARPATPSPPHCSQPLPSIPTPCPHSAPRNHKPDNTNSCLSYPNNVTAIRSKSEHGRVRASQSQHLVNILETGGGDDGGAVRTASSHAPPESRTVERQLAVVNASGYLSNKCHRRRASASKVHFCQLLPIPKPSLLPPPANCMEMDLKKYKAMHSMGRL